MDSSMFNGAVVSSARSISETMAILDEQSKEQKNREDRQLAAMEATANNTAETNARLNRIIDNQNDYIDTLQEQLKVSRAQLGILNNIFASEEDAVAVEKEIMRIIQNEIDDKHPLWDYVKDKGGDLMVTGTTVGVPVLYKSFKTFLATKGIFMP